MFYGKLHSAKMYFPSDTFSLNIFYLEIKNITKIKTFSYLINFYDICQKYDKKTSTANCIYIANKSYVFLFLRKIIYFSNNTNKKRVSKLQICL